MKKEEEADSEGTDSELEEEKKAEGDEEAKKEPEAPEHKPLKKGADELKKSLFMGVKYGHFKLGTYVRIEIQVEKTYSRQLKPEQPLVLCSLKQQESGFAYMRVRIKKHRWYPHILKTRDPITFSMGWRKF